MKADDILLLIKAGYTKNDIDSMTISPKSAESSDDTAPAPETGSNASPDPEPAPPEEDSPEAAAIEELRRANEALKLQIKQIQSQNVKTKDGGMPEKLSADKVIADFFGR